MTETNCTPEADVLMTPAIYELTARVANGDDHWTRAVCDNFHDAAVAGLEFAARKQGRLVRIERIRTPREDQT